MPSTLKNRLGSRGMRARNRRSRAKRQERKTQAFFAGVQSREDRAREQWLQLENQKELRRQREIARQQTEDKAFEEDYRAQDREEWDRSHSPGGSEFGKEFLKPAPLRHDVGWGYPRHEPGQAAADIRRLMAKLDASIPVLSDDEVASQKPQVHRAATMALFDPPQRSIAVATVEKPSLFVRFLDWCDDVYYYFMAKYSSRPLHNSDRPEYRD